jgi:hypothetical protein
MEIRPEPIRASRRLPLQLLVAAVLLAIAVVAVGASLIRPGALASSSLEAAAGASAAPAASPDASSAPDRGHRGPFNFGFGFGFGNKNGNGPTLPNQGGFGGRGSFLGAISITAIDGAKVSLQSATGWSRIVDTTGLPITRAGVTITVADLSVGEKVTIDQTRNTDGTYAVKGIAVALDSAGGAVTKVDAASITVSRGNSTSTITTDSSTVYRRDGQTIGRSDIAVGAQIVATGTTAADGTLAAAAIDVQPDAVFGTVTKIDGNTLTISTFGGGTATVVITAKTTIKVAGKDSATVSDITLKSMVAAFGVKDAKGVLTADSIRAGSQRPPTTNPKGWHFGLPNASPSASAGTSG